MEINKELVIRMRRRLCLAAAGWCAARLANAQGGTATHADNSPHADAYPRAERGHALVFPRDFGAHPAYRTEWWYATGWLDADRAPLGFQITFFRTRLAEAENSPSRFAPKQIVFAHAAIADPARGALLHAQDALRIGFGDALAQEGDTRVRLRGWRLERDASSGTYAAHIATPDFALDLALAPTQAVLLQGEAGWSRKAADPHAASYYYSQPQLRVTGRVRDHGAVRSVAGRAWLDHEWSSTYLDRGAAGWDWIGVNLDDGSALMAFRIRPRTPASANAQAWAGATLRDANGATRTFESAAIAFTPLRAWTSPRTGARYPVAMAVQVANRTFTLNPLFDDQELDSRTSTGVVYWEGAVEVREREARVGRGYLELTGYAGALRL